MPNQVLKGGAAEAGRQVLVEPRAPLCEDAVPTASPFVAPAAAAGRTPPLVASAQQQAARIMAQARTEADELKQAALDEIEAVRASTTAELDRRAAALEQTVRAEVEADLQARLGAAATALQQAAAELHARRSEFLSAIEQPAYELTLAVARHLLAAELKQPQAYIGALLARAFTLLKPEKVAVLAVSPALLAQLTADQSLLAALPAAGISLTRIELTADELLRAGQFSLRVNGVSVDYDLPAALDEIMAHLSLRGAAYLADPEVERTCCPLSSLEADPDAEAVDRTCCPLSSINSNPDAMGAAISGAEVSGLEEEEEVEEEETDSMSVPPGSVLPGAAG